MINVLPTQSVTRTPRGIVSINGTYITWIEFEIVNTNYYLASTFSLSLPITNQPAGIDLSYWSSQPAIVVQLYAGFPANPENYTVNDLESLIYAQVDDIEIDPINNMVHLSGRDFTAKFIDNKTSEKYPNNTSSQIATILANKYNLTPVVTDTTTKVGNYYQIDYTKLNNEVSEWDLLTFLAQEENFIVFVRNQELHFQPIPTESSEPYLLQYVPRGINGEPPQFNGYDLKVTRSLTIAKDVLVRVRSWNPKAGKAFTVEAKATKNKKTALSTAAQPAGDAQIYSYVYPNLSKEQAINKAQQLLASITQHERVLRASLPADNLLKVENIIQLNGTNSDLDQTYYPSSIKRTLSMDEGYQMNIEAKNHSPQTQVIV